MLTAVPEPGDDMDRCNKGDLGGTGSRFYFLMFRNQIPGFLIFRIHLLMAEKGKRDMNATP